MRRLRRSARAPHGPFVRLTERGLPPAACMAFDDASGPQAAASTVHVVAGGTETALGLPVQQGLDGGASRERTARPMPGVGLQQAGRMSHC